MEHQTRRFATDATTLGNRAMNRFVQLTTLLLLSAVSGWALPKTCNGPLPTNAPCAYYPAAIAWTGIGAAIERYVDIYIPSGLPSTNIPVVVYLHPTLTGAPKRGQADSCFSSGAFVSAANKDKFIAICPSSTYDGAKWVWNAIALAGLFSSVPDDSGFINYVICLVSAPTSGGGACSNSGGPAGYGFAVNTNLIGVIGGSSGGFMANRFGIDFPNVPSMIGNASGMIWAQTPGTGNPTPPGPKFSVIELHSDNDPLVKFCGGTIAAWGQIGGALPNIPSAGTTLSPVEGDIPFWINSTSNNCNASRYSALCTAVNGAPIPDPFFCGVAGKFITEYDDPACNSTPGLEVKFIRVCNSTQHGFAIANSISTMIQFFFAHPKLGGH